MIKIKLSWFGGACPTQGEGKTSDGYNIYVRYRWGYLSVRRSLTKEGDAVGGHEIFSCKVGGGLDGTIRLSDVNVVTRGFIEFEMSEETKYDV